MFVMYEKENIRFITGERKIYASSPGVGRTFCPDCGTPLSYEGEWGGKSIVEVYVGTLDDPESFTPDRHGFYGEKISWFDVADQLPRYNASSVGKQPDRHGPMVKGA